MSLRVIGHAIRQNVWAATLGQIESALSCGDLSEQPAKQAVKKELGKEQIDA